ncbi:hypothetical protein C8Q76DRAFT_636353, partial [Earliella scabrosa]
ALLRDGFRCMVTGGLDKDSVKVGLVTPSTDYFAIRTVCARIFPESLGVLEGVDREAKGNSVATASTVLNRFGYTHIQNELEGTNVHRLENILTLALDAHDYFDDLQMCFEAVPDRPHTYRVVAHPPFNPSNRYPREVTFTSNYGLPLPSPKYLLIHAACGRIAHLSGAAEYVDRIQYEREDKPVLESDGSSALVLDFLLQRLGGPGGREPPR